MNSVSPSPMDNASSWSLTARWIFPVDRPPLANGVVVIAGDRIAAVEPAGTRRADVDLGNTALLPGLVNAHTHLDLSGLAGLCPPAADFTGWLRRVIQHRRHQSSEQIESDIRQGLAQCLGSGTTLIGDISAGGMSWPILREAPIRSVVFHELLGLTEARAEQAWQSGHDWLQAHSATNTCQPALSPHAPYSVRSSLFARMAELPVSIPVAIHVAESRDELELLDNRDGPFVTFLQELGVWDSVGLIDGLADLLRMYAHRPVLLVHGNHLQVTDPLSTQSTIVYCPRTHAAFGHPPHPFRQFLEHGHRVALGTDSLASNPDLDTLAELRFLHTQHPDLPGDVLLRLATLSGAEALGWADETGSLTPGKSADLIAVPLTEEENDDPHLLLLRSSAAVTRIWCRGMEVKKPLAV